MRCAGQNDYAYAYGIGAYAYRFKLRLKGVSPLPLSSSLRSLGQFLQTAKAPMPAIGEDGRMTGDPGMAGDATATDLVTRLEGVVTRLESLDELGMRDHRDRSRA